MLAAHEETIVIFHLYTVTCVRIKLIKQFIILLLVHKLNISVCIIIIDNNNTIIIIILYLIRSIAPSCITSHHHPPERITGVGSLTTEAWVSESSDTEEEDGLGGERVNCCW